MYPLRALQTLTSNVGQHYLNASTCSVPSIIFGHDMWNSKSGILKMLKNYRYGPFDKSIGGPCALVGKHTCLENADTLEIACGQVV